MLHERDATARLRDRCDELEETVRQLKGQLVPEQASLQALGLTRIEALLLGALRKASPAVVSYERLTFVMESHGFVGGRSVHVYKCMMRQRLARAGMTIKTSFGQGFFLSLADKARLDVLVADNQVPPFARSEPRGGFS